MRSLQSSNAEEHEKLLLSCPIIAEMNFVDGDYRRTVRQPERDTVLIKRTDPLNGSIVYEKKIIWEGCKTDD